MDVTLQAEKRTDKGKNEARRHRAAGRLPAIVYGPVAGGGIGPAVSVSVDPKALSRILHSESGANTIISLQLDGESTPVLVKDFLLHPVTHALLHADLYRVAMDRKLTVTVPVTLKGDARGVKQTSTCWTGCHGRSSSDASRMPAGPKRAPGRIEVAVSNGTPTMATSRPSGELSSGARANVRMPV